MPWVAPLVLTLWIGGVTSRSPDIDAAAVQRALEIRAGDRARSWTIDLDSRRGGEVRARMRGPSGRELRRTYTLVGTTDEERSRELAGALALVLEQDSAEPVAASTEAPASAEPVAPTGWIAAGARLAAGRPRGVDGGAMVRGGALWGRRILQPLAAVGSVHARRGSLRLDGVRAGVGLAVGSPWRRFWFGGSVVPSLMWARARDRGHDDVIGSVTEVTGLFQWRGARGLLLAARTGIDVLAPPLRAIGGEDVLRTGAVRFVVGLEVGLVLPPARQR